MKNIISTCMYRKGLMTGKFAGISLFLVILVVMAFTFDQQEWRQLFNGKDLTGWKHAGPGGHYVEDGLIKSHGGMGLLYWHGEKFGNSVIRVVFRMRDENSNSGVFIRIPIEPREEWSESRF